MPDINDLLRDHVTLDVECVDRLYLNGYIPLLQTGGQLVTFIREHLKQPIPSPAVLGKITDRFRDNVQRFAQEQAVPLIHFKSGQRKDDLANDRRRKSGCGPRRSRMRTGFCIIGTGEYGLRGWMGAGRRGCFRKLNTAPKEMGYRS